MSVKQLQGVIISNMVKNSKKKILSLLCHYHRKKPKNVRIISSCYVFLGANVTALIAFAGDRKNLDIGIAFFMLAIVSYMETEKKRYGDDAVFGSCLIHCVVTIAGAWYCSAWWIMALYIIEVLTLIHVALHEPKAKSKK